MLILILILLILLALLLLALARILPAFSVRRPVTVVMIFLFITLMGLICWAKLPQEFYPPITFPQLTVKTIYKDAAPEEIEILVTKPIEEVVGTVSGLKRISSISKEETSIVIAEFEWGKNMDIAGLHVREKIDLIKEKLPRNAEDPIVLKYNPFERPVMVLNITGKRKSHELLEFSKRMIKNELEKVEGVAAATLRGGLEREVLVEIDQGRLQASGVSIVKISDALQKSNLNFPAGTIKEEFYEYLVRTIGEFKVVPEIEETIVGVDKREVSLIKKRRPETMTEAQKEEEKEKKEAEKRLIYLKNIGRVKDTFKERTSYSRYNGEETILLSISKQAGTHTLTVANNVKRALRRLRKDLPQDIKVDIAFDQSVMISQAISGVRDAAVIGGILAFLILFLFLKSIISSIIVAVSILLSVLATITLMLFSGLTLNMISLGGLALGIGMLVDNSIVVIESVFRHRLLGKGPKEASVVGAQEVGGAIGASTITTMAVFVPVIFVIGIIGQVFGQLAFTIVSSLAASLFVALTLIATLASKQRKEVVFAETKSGIEAFLETKLKTLHLRVLKEFIRNKGKNLFKIFIIFLCCIFLLFMKGREFLPKVDQGQFAVRVEMPPGTRLEVTDRVARRIENMILAMPETKSVSVNVGSKEEEARAEEIETLGSHQAEILVTLKPRARGLRRLFPVGAKLRRLSSQDVVENVKQGIKEPDLEGGEVEYMVQETEFQTAFQAGAPIVIEIKGDKIDVLEALAEKVKEKIKVVKGIYGIRDSLVKPSPETKVNIIKDRAATYNLSVHDISLTAQTAIKGYVPTKFKEAGKEIDIRVRLREKDRKDLTKVRRLLVHSPLDLDVPLTEVAYIGVGKGPTEIRRLGQQRVVLVSANISHRGSGAVIEDVKGKLKEIEKPFGYSVELTGEYERRKESEKSLLFALILAIIFVYMIMAAQFESLWQPFVIMFTFPLSLIGVATALFICFTPLSVMVILGIIVLGGIVVNNGIVLIDYTNQLRRQGLGAEEAVTQASQVRLRPIIMTALTTVLGLVPLALAIRPGTEIQSPMAIAVMGGLLVSTFLSLVVIPAIYLGVDEFLQSRRKESPNTEHRTPNTE